MAFIIDESMLPATLTAHPMTDEEFEEFCAQHEDLRIELSAEGELILMPPVFSITAARNSAITGQLQQWARNDSRGIVIDSSGGFVLPNSARRSPDAAWIAKSRIRQLESRRGFWRLAPDFVIELKSESDRLRVLRKKMDEWITNGVQLGWLIDPESRIVEIYRPGHEPELRGGLESLPGEGPVEGFVLDLRPVWDPLGE
jgi:Uma2 family endonuclease